MAAGQGESPEGVWKVSRGAFESVEGVDRGGSGRGGGGGLSSGDTLWRWGHLQ